MRSKEEMERSYRWLIGIIWVAGAVVYWNYSAATTSDLTVRLIGSFIAPVVVIWFAAICLGVSVYGLYTMAELFAEIECKVRSRD